PLALLFQQTTPGQSLLLQIRVLNQGTIGTGTTFRVAVIADAQVPTLTNPPLVIVDAPALAANESVILSATLLANQLIGAHYVVAIADIDDSVTETRKDNNFAVLSLDGTTPPPAILPTATSTPTVTS